LDPVEQAWQAFDLIDEFDRLRQPTRSRVRYRTRYQFCLQEAGHCRHGAAA
jgi:hypothetical protein